jgi:hypothetical protein
MLKDLFRSDDEIPNPNAANAAGAIPGTKAADRKMSVVLVGVERYPSQMSLQSEIDSQRTDNAKNFWNVTSHTDHAVLRGSNHSCDQYAGSDAQHLVVYHRQ